MNTKSYPFALSDAQWNILESLLPSKAATGRPRKYSLRLTVDAMLYILNEGCRWRSLPYQYPPWQTIYSWSTRLHKDGALEAIRVHLVCEPNLAIRRERHPMRTLLIQQFIR